MTYHARALSFSSPRPLFCLAAAVRGGGMARTRDERLALGLKFADLVVEVPRTVGGIPLFCPQGGDLLFEGSELPVRPLNARHRVLGPRGTWGGCNVHATFSREADHTCLMSHSCMS